MNVGKKQKRESILKPDEILSPADDWIFKLLFGDERDKHLLIGLLGSFLELPEEEYDIVFLDTHLKREKKDDKLGIVDVRIRTKTGKIINVEIQVGPFTHIGERISFYKSKLVTEQINKSQSYKVIQKVICICIINDYLFPRRKEYLNRFLFYNPKTGLLFDKIPEEVYTIELPKLPKKYDGNQVWDWLKFLCSKEKKEFDMVAKKNSLIRDAVDKLYLLSGNKKLRAEYEYRLKARLDYNTGMIASYEDGEEKHRKYVLDLIDQGLSTEEIKQKLKEK